jgi:hypothetical protein
MRSTIVKGIDDGIYINLGSSTDIVGEVMLEGKSVDYLIYELELSGKDLLGFLAKFRVDEELMLEIKAENKYKVIAYDW